MCVSPHNPRCQSRLSRCRIKFTLLSKRATFCIDKALDCAEETISALAGVVRLPTCSSAQTDDYLYSSGNTSSWVMYMSQRQLDSMECLMSGETFCLQVEDNKNVEMV